MIWFSLDIASLEGAGFLSTWSEGSVAMPKPLPAFGLESTVGEVARTSTSLGSWGRLEFDLVGAGGAGDRGCWCIIRTVEISSHTRGIRSR